MNFKRKNKYRTPRAKKFILDIYRWGCGKNKRILVEKLRPKHRNSIIDQEQ